MGDTTIEWTDRTWNPVVGCSRVSEGCRHCYAETMAARIANAGQAKLRRGGTLTATETAYREVVRWERGGLTPADERDKAIPRWNGQVRLIRERLADPLTWRNPSRIFVNSMSDLFHAGLSNEDIAAVFGVMAAAPWHTFQVLTKRPERAACWFMGITLSGAAAMIRYDARFRDVEAECARCGRPHLGRPDEPTPELRAIYDAAPLDSGEYHWRPWPLPNVWLGVSVENQATANERIPLLLECPAAVRWISAEPLLGPVDLTPWFRLPRRRGDAPWIGWVVAGGESGHGARACYSSWARGLRDQCAAAGVPFLWKQWGEYLPDEQNPDVGPSPGGTEGGIRVGKAAAGRLLDGVLHDEYPEVTP